MSLRHQRILGLALALAAAVAACAPEPAPVETPAAEPASAVPISATETLPAAIPTVVPADLPTDLLAPGTNALIMLRGQARITHDNGATWSASGTGQHLNPGDEIQTTGDSLALVILLNGGVVRLEGPSDFQILRAERDPGSGAFQIIVKLWDGYGLFEANPLPTPESIFHFHVMTTFVALEYDPQAAAAVAPGAGLDPERSVIAGGLLNEETEKLFHFRGPASLIQLDQYEGTTIAAELPAAVDEYTDLEAAFLDGYEAEADLEAFGPTAGYLIAACKLRGSCDGVDVSGNTVTHVAQLNLGATLYFFGRPQASGLPLPPELLGTIVDTIDRFADQQTDATASPAVSIRWTEFGRVRWRRITGWPPASRAPQVAGPDLQILADEAPGFGCDPASGSGCLPPAECDPANGAGCELPTGCNLITHVDCTDVYIVPPYTPADDGGGGYRLTVPGAIDPGCDPNAPGGCDSAYDPAQWTSFEESDDETAACWCPANPPPPGYGAPPPGMFMYYRCFCSDPGALSSRPTR